MPEITNDTIAYVAGRSGGHILPALAHAQAYRREQNPAAQVLFFTTSTPLDIKIIQGSEVVSWHHPFDLENVPRNPLFFILYVCKMLIALLRALRILYAHKPRYVMTTGGYVALPVCYAAWLLGIPVHLYQLDVLPGRAGSWISRCATVTHVCFNRTTQLLPSTARCEGAHYPLRFGPEHILKRDEACEILGINAEKKVLFVIGGSQGSQELNEVVAEYARSLSEVEREALCILHQTGKDQKEHVEQKYEDFGIEHRVFSYDPNVHYYYSAADLVITRAGAGTLFELLYFNKKSLIIPLITPTNTHQRDNAYTMSCEHGELFSMLEPAESREALPTTIRRLLV